MSGVLSILKNEALENWEFSEMALSNEDLEKIATAVWAKQYGTDSTERRFGVKNQRARDYNMLGAIYGYDAVRNVNALAQIVAGMAQRVALDPAGMKALQAVLAVPPAEDNAEAVVGAFGGVDTETLAQTLRNVLGAEQAAELGAALSEDDADLIK